MSNYLRKLGVFHTPPPLSVPQDATLTGYVINTNGLNVQPPQALEAVPVHPLRGS